MTRRPFQLLPTLAAGLLLGVAGCERPGTNTGVNSDPGATPSPEASASRPPTTAPRGQGVVAGKVRLVGFQPTVSSNTVPCGSHNIVVRDETVVLASDGALANAVVYLENAPSAGPTTLPPATLDQVNCQYVPHVLALEVGQTLRVKSSDATLHNVHALCDENPALNFGMKGPGVKEVRFDRPEFVRVKCDVHPWMSAHVAVLPNPYFAVTGPDGSFSIPHVPPGTYTLVAWHEKFDALEQPVTVTDSTPVTASFTYEPPTP